MINEYAQEYAKARDENLKKNTIQINNSRRRKKSEKKNNKIKQNITKQTTYPLISLISPMSVALYISLFTFCKMLTT
jgi:hypothetical protein